MNASERLIDTPMNANDHGDIVFSCYDFNLDRGVCTINSDGSNFRVLLDASGFTSDPAWSPDGGRIAYSSHRDGGYHIWILDLNVPQSATNPQNITVGQSGYVAAPRWSPDGSQILFGSDGLYLASLSTPTPVISQIPLPDGLDPYWVADWSPQGDQIVFNGHNYTTGDSGVYIITLATNSVSKVVNRGTNEGISNVAWSPLGNEVAYDWWFEDGTGSIPEVVKIVDLASQNVRTLEATSASPSQKDPAWSPDGAQIALNGNPMRKVSAGGGNAFPINFEVGGSGVDWRQSASPSETCIGIVDVTTTTAIIRSTPNGAELPPRIPDGQAVLIVGKQTTWYYVDANYGQYPSPRYGWMSSTVLDYTACADVKLPIRNNDGSIVTAAYDYDLPTPPETWNPRLPTGSRLTCTDAGTEQNRLNCTRLVYYEYYYTFINSRQRPPLLSDALSSMYYYEIARTIPGNTLGFEAFAINFWAVVNSHSNCTLSSCTPSEAMMSGEDITEHYLSSLQAWYAVPSTNNIPDVTRFLTGEVSRFSGSALLILTERRGCNSSDDPCTWGNYPYRESNYANIHTGNTVILYCLQFQRYSDTNGNEMTDDMDDWYEYRFSINHSWAGEIDTYNKTKHLRPLWLDDADTRNTNLPWYKARPQRENLSPQVTCFPY